MNRMPNTIAAITKAVPVLRYRFEKAKNALMKPSTIDKMSRGRETTRENIRKEQAFVASTIR